jgi:hypothetical protein
MRQFRELDRGLTFVGVFETDTEYGRYRVKDSPAAAREGRVEPLRDDLFDNIYFFTPEQLPRVFPPPVAEKGEEIRDRGPPGFPDRRFSTGQRHIREMADPLEIRIIAGKELKAPEVPVSALPRSIEDNADRFLV